MKKIIVATAAALLAVGAQAATYKDGSYTGEGKGRESVITVQVDVKGGKIADVKVVKHGETEMIIAAPIEQMIPEIVKKNGVEGVDSVGGATLSSEGIKAAVKDARPPFLLSELPISVLIRNVCKKNLLDCRGCGALCLVTGTFYSCCRNGSCCRV